MALRVTRQYAEVLGTGEGKARVTRQYVEVLGTGDSKLRVTRQYIEILSNAGPLQVTRQCIAVLGDPPVSGVRVTRQSVAVLAEKTTEARVVQQYVEAAGTAPVGGSAQVWQQYVEVLGDPLGIVTVNATDTLVVSDEAKIAEILCYVTDTLSLGESAAREFVAERGATDVLSLSDGAIGAKIYTVASSDTLVVSDYASGEIIRFAIDTLVLSDAASAEIVYSTADTLSLSDEAIVTVVLARGSADSLSLGEIVDRQAILIRDHRDYLDFTLTDAATGERIKLASDTLVLTDYAGVDRILAVSDSLVLDDIAAFDGIYVRLASDALVLSEDAIGNKEILRDASDVLSLGESNVGDYCRVCIDTLTISDVADAVYVKPVYDTLSLSENADPSTSIYNRKKIESLSLSEVAAGWREKTGNATDALSLTEKATLILWAKDALSLSDVADANYCRAAFDTLSLSEAAEVSTSHLSAIDDLVGLSDTATYGFVRIRDAQDQITTLHDHALPGFRRLAASDVLQEEHIDYGPPPDYTPIITYVGLQDQADVSIVYYAPKTAEDHLSFAEGVLGIKIRADAIPVGATDALSLSDGAYASVVAGAQDSLVLSDEAEATASRLLADELELSDEATFNINRNSLSATDTLVLGESVSWYNRLEDYLWVYHPFVGEGPATNPDPPDEDLEGPIPGITDPFKLVYPAVGPFTDSLVLRTPNFGNRDKLQMNRISRETRGGTLVVYADPMWPKIQTLAVAVSGLTWTQASGLHTFIDSHLGLEIGMLDWEHRFWKGIVTKFDDPIVQDGRGCKYTVSFEFEGEMATYSP